MSKVTRDEMRMLARIVISSITFIMKILKSMLTSIGLLISC